VEGEKSEKSSGPLKSILKSKTTPGEGRKVSFRPVLADYVEPAPINVIDGKSHDGTSVRYMLTICGFSFRVFREF
jgi:hypothetical protein